MNGNFKLISSGLHAAIKDIFPFVTNLDITISLKVDGIKIKLPYKILHIPAVIYEKGYEVLFIIIYISCICIIIVSIACIPPMPTPSTPTRIHIHNHKNIGLLWFSTAIIPWKSLGTPDCKYKCNIFYRDKNCLLSHPSRPLFPNSNETCLY